MNESWTGPQRRLLLLVLLMSAAVLSAVSFAALASRHTPAPPVAPTLPVAVTATPAPSVAPLPTPTPAPTPIYDFSQPAPITAEPVADDYFADAVFLGDSRSDGLRLYSGIRGADFLAYKALMVFEVTGSHHQERKKIPVDGTKMTVLSALERKQYGKVYLMFGINELGWNKNEDFAEAYRLLIDEVRTRQPNAIIYIESLIPVNPEACLKSKAPYYITNDRIVAYNEILRRVATEKSVVYLDLATDMADENGILPPEGTTDGIHFKKTWYIKWFESLKAHTVDPVAYLAGQAEEGSDSNA